MSYRYKIGTKLLCIKDHIMHDGRTTYTKGNVYIINKTHCYNIPDDYDNQHSMGDDSYIDEYFTLSRILKLKRILEK